MRRRKQKNPLLMRIVLVSVLVHIIALPILAKFGAFKKIQKQFLETKMVVLPAPTPEKKEPEAKKKAAAKPAQAAKKSSSSAAHQASRKSNLNMPKVVASAATNGSGDGSDSATVDANGSGKAGVIPTLKSEAKTETKQAAVPVVKANDTPKTETAVKQVPNVTPPKVETSTPVNVAPPRESVFVGASAISSPQPSIPDDLRSDAFDKDFKAELVVSPEGVPTQIKITKSTGNGQLDRIAVETAKQWRFKPATRDGQPAEDRIILHIEFQVN